MKALACWALLFLVALHGLSVSRSAEKKDPKKDTAHQAAKALLDKYTRRPRG